MHATMPKMNVLLVEDNPADAWLVRDLIFRQTPHIKLTLLNDGDKAEHYLMQDIPAGKCVAPDVILLDLNLPKKSGRELLKEIRLNPRLHFTPVFILSSSHSQEDRDDCQKLGATSFLTKPNELRGFIDLVRQLVDVDFPQALARAAQN